MIIENNGFEVEQNDFQKLGYSVEVPDLPMSEWFKIKIKSIFLPNLACLYEIHYNGIILRTKEIAKPQVFENLQVWATPEKISGRWEDSVSSDENLTSEQKEGLVAPAKLRDLKIETPSGINFQEKIIAHQK